MSEFASDMDKFAYAVGMNMGEYVEQMAVKMDGKMVAAGLADYLAGASKLDPAEYQDAMKKLQELMRAAGEKELAAVSEANRAAEAKFMAENAKAEGVKVTESGLQYKVIEEGTGAKPSINSKVRVHYQGSLLDGTVFDSSIARGEPLEFMLTQVIAGWTEGLQLMSEGSKYRLFIPAKLGYGSRGAGQAIPPDAALIFDVELIAIV
ncbi:MAG: FKBP-type peptidyl-prolyl cis-trans isomerase [Lentisphaerae bacterium]|nr:FKBP-type peptidyl-prolyl cis-trans isomerase [Lentisphaerota bacterium]